MKSGDRGSAAKGNAGPKDVDEYLAGVPEPARGTLKRVRAVIRSAALMLEHIGQREKTYAVYDIDGDTLRISVNEGDEKTYPTDFDTKATNAHIVYEFKRVPPEKADKI